MFYIYTDASFRNTDKVGVIGFLIFENEPEHNVANIEAADFHSIVIKESNNIRCEFRAVLAAMKFIQPRLTAHASSVKIHTDCQAVTKLTSRREHLEKNQFQSLSSGTRLANADLYEEFFSLYDAIKPVIHWIKGHASQESQNAIQRNFSYVDKAVRRQLRAIPDVQMK
ncbi:MAG: hypothetical protein M3Q07_18350 [Pseudobdellovibrionaceae bacterium]|nr:hypothetical protein [Pseudobdellovibrionaceae bacterium]